MVSFLFVRVFLSSAVGAGGAIVLVISEFLVVVGATVSVLVWGFS